MMRHLPVASLLALALASVAGCRQVPATLQYRDPEPPPPSKPFVEAQPGRTTSESFAYISEDVAELYRCWFRDPYEYMFAFEGEPLDFQGRRHGVYMAGTHGILYYGGLTDCAAALLDQRARGWGDIGPLAQLAGVPASLGTTDLDFEQVNPEFIAYARRELLPHPEQTIDGVSAQLAYDLVFRRFFRLMGASVIHLLESRQIDWEVDDYLNAVRGGVDGIAWLEGRYAGQIAGFDDHRDYTTLTPSMAVGFWLRRRADGSFAASWHGLRDVLIRYDASWLDEQLRRSPTAAAALAQLPDPML